MLEVRKVIPEKKELGTFTFALETMGCKANTADSHILAKRLEKLGGVWVQQAPEVFILNSCTVTDRASRDALSLIRKKNALLRVFTGCLAEVAPNLLREFEKENLILARNSAKVELPKSIVDTLANLKKGMPIKARLLKGDRLRWHSKMDDEKNFFPRASRTRIFLKVQDGCDQFCSYCIIPLARGRSRSLPAHRVVEEVHAAQDQGVKEVVLTAIHAGDYRDGKRSFFSLVREVLEKTDIPRIRLTSLDPAEINEELYALMAENSRLCPHFHVSVQSMSSKVLASMKRVYDADRAEECLWQIQERFPHAFVGMDMITGFPTEGEDDWAETMLRLQRSPWSVLHVFPYSKRKSTFAATMLEKGEWKEGEKLKRDRAQILRNLSAVRFQESLERKRGKILEVLTENKPFVWKGKAYRQGLSRSYHRIVLGEEGKDISPNLLLRVNVTGVIGGRALFGKLV